MTPLTTNAQSLKFESKIPWSTVRRPKKLRKAQEGHLEEGKSKSQQQAKKRQSQPKWPRRVKKSLEEHEKLKLSTKAQNQHSLWNQLPLTLSMQALPLR
jgi:hypothetical protein